MWNWVEVHEIHHDLFSPSFECPFLSTQSKFQTALLLHRHAHAHMQIHTHTHTHTQDIFSHDCKASSSSFRCFPRYHILLPDPLFKHRLETPPNIAITPWDIRTRALIVLYFNYPLIWLNSQLLEVLDYVLLAIISHKQLLTYNIYSIIIYWANNWVKFKQPKITILNQLLA